MTQQWKLALAEAEKRCRYLRYDALLMLSQMFLQICETIIFRKKGILKYLNQNIGNRHWLDEGRK